MIRVTATLEVLKQATAELEAAYAKGYTESVAVLTLIQGGRCIAECVVEYDGLLAEQPGENGLDLGWQHSAKRLPDYSKMEE
jgi:hypothetical protein